MPFRASVTTVVKPATALFTGGQPYDLVSLGTIKDELVISDSQSDTFLYRAITQASAYASQYCERIFPVETVRDEFWPRREPSAAIRLGVESLQLTRWPVAAVPATAGVAPPPAPVLSAAVAGALAATKYYVVITYVTAAGETPASQEASLSVAANQVLKVASPAADSAGLATGYNVYVGTVAGQETLQNVSPIALGASWTEPASGLIVGAAVPALVAVIENAVPLCEGVDFRVDYRFGQVIRLDGNLYPKRWPLWALSVQYPAGFAAIPADLADATIRMVKGRWFARQRDPQLRGESAVGIYDAQYWFGAGPGSSGGLPPDIAAILDGYRTPVLA